MKVLASLKSIPLGQRYGLGWRVIGMIFSMYIALELLMRGLTFIGKLIGHGYWEVNDIAAVWMFMIAFLVLAPPIASIFLGCFFPLDRLVTHDESAA